MNSVSVSVQPEPPQACRRRAGTPAVGLAAVLLLCACANPLLTLHDSRTVTVETSQVTLRWGEEDAPSQTQVANALEAGLPALNRWSGLPGPVTLSLLPSHDALERVTGRHGYGWLRAWATFDQVLLQSPRTWGPPPNDAAVAEWLTHELTHCLLFQRSGTAETWQTLHIPLWFREGMATVTARQGYRFASLEDLATWQLQHPDLDVFTDGEALSRDVFDRVYGLSHHAMAFFIRRYGDAGLTRVMTEMHAGAEFEPAFTRAIGVTPAAFIRDFRNYLRLRGFRGLGLPMRPKPIVR